jgi:hypothetical protein
MAWEYVTGNDRKVNEGSGENEGITSRSMEERDGKRMGANERIPSKSQQHDLCALSVLCG